MPAAHHWEDAMLFEAVQRWVQEDVDAGDQDELTRLRNTARGEDAAALAALTELRDRFSGTLEFGTAGLRGAMAAGPNRMNRAVVIRAAAGLAAYLRDAVMEAKGIADTPPLVVIGYDARHRSHDFAHDTAAVLTAAGVRVKLYDKPRPTPTLAFAVRALAADAGVMVTASHNPAADNGYKVYLGARAVPEQGQGSQIVPPYDSAIAAKIAQAPPACDVPRATSGWDEISNEVVAQYRETIPVSEATKPLKIVATPMHGVGGELLADALHRAGFNDVTLVPEQAEPDPDFPTVPFPNPEEPGALDLAFSLAAQTSADIVIAVDPDADRCAVGVRDPYQNHSWRVLHGDELGAILGQEIASRFREKAPAQAPPVLANSIVSSSLLGQIALDHGLAYSPTLTGFKWISRVPHLIFGYEEAIGYCIDPQHVKDKDGISAAVLAAQVAARLKVAGSNLVEELDGLALRHGLYLTSQVNLRLSDRSRLVSMIENMLANPPAQLGGSEVVRVDDLADGVDGLPPTTGVRLLAADGTRVIMRPSGTEPKVKAYLEVIESLQPDATKTQIAEARQRAADRLRSLGETILPQKS